jgi:hypothetical protein
MEDIAMDIYSLLHSLDSRQSELCPYQAVDSSICAASISSITIDSARNSGYCSTDNYDNCALFLAKTLRTK